MASDVSSYSQDDSAGAAGSPGDSGSDSSSAPDASASSDNGAGSASSDSSNGAGQDSSAAAGSNGSASDSSSSGQDSSAAADSSSDGSAADSSSSGQDSSAAADSSSDGSAADSSGSGAGQDASASADSTSDGSGTGSSSAGDSASGGDDQTPAKDLALDPIQPASTTADAGVAGASQASSDGSAAVPTAEGGVSVSDIIAVGTTTAKIMAASSPDYSMKSSPASVLPRGADPLALSGVAADPHELKITLNLHNKATMLIVNLPIVVQWRFGGSNKGVGRYITSASVFLDSGADVGAFYKADVDASLTGPWNAGSDSAPVAAISVMVDVKVTDKISPYGQNIVLDGSIQGDGYGILKQRPDA